MSKKRKTKKEKIQATQRRDFSSLLNLSIRDVSRSQTTPEVKEHMMTPKSYVYVAADARKTIFITSVIIGLNIIFLLILKFKFISLFGILF